MCDSKWLFTEDQLAAYAKMSGNSFKVSEEKDILYRQEATQIIQEMGQRLRVSQLCINSAIVYFHRFYVFHPFSLFPRHEMAAASFFLAAKVEEHPRKAIDVIKVLGILLEPNRKMSEKEMNQKVSELIQNEDFLVTTLGFNFFIEHPHVHIVNAIQNFRSLPGFTDMGNILYFIATCTLHLTTMCLKYPSTAIAASCIDVTCRWLEYELPAEIHEKAWYHHIDESLTEEILTKLRREFFAVLDMSSSRTRARVDAVMNKNEAPKLPVAHRSTSALQEKKTNNQKVKGTSSSQVKRPYLEATKRYSKASTAENLPQRSLKLQKSRENLQTKTHSAENSQVSGSMSQTIDSDLSNKRKYEPVSDDEVHEEAYRPHKVGKFEATTETNFDSPPNAESNHNLMNVNLKLTFVPSEDPYSQMFPPQSFDDDLFNFSHGFNSADFDGDRINAGC